PSRVIEESFLEECVCRYSPAGAFRPLFARSVNPFRSNASDIPYRGVTTPPFNGSAEDRIEPSAARASAPRHPGGTAARRSTVERYSHSQRLFARADDPFGSSGAGGHS